MYAIRSYYAYTTTGQAWKVLDALIDPINKRLVPEAGVRSLGFLEKGFRVLTSNRAVRTMDDLKGLKLRVSPNTIAIETFKS